MEWISSMFSSSWGRIRGAMHERVDEDDSTDGGNRPNHTVNQDTNKWISLDIVDGLDANAKGEGDGEARSESFVGSEDAAEEVMYALDLPGVIPRGEQFHNTQPLVDKQPSTDNLLSPKQTKPPYASPKRGSKASKRIQQP